MAGYELGLTPSHDWLEFWRLNTSCGWLEFLWMDMSYRWLHPMSNLSSGGWIRLKTDSILPLTRVPAARYRLHLILSYGWLEFYTLIYQVKLRTYSPKHIIFMVCFLTTDNSYHWSRVWLLFQEPWRGLKKLEEAWRSFKTVAATHSSCSGWFELQRLIQDLRPIDYLQNFDPNTPWYFLRSRP